MNPNSLQYVLGQIKEVHSEEFSLVVGEPVIISKNEDGTINFYVSLTKYPVEKIMGALIKGVF